METNTATTTKWTIDPVHSEVQFKVKHLMISTVTGSFQRFDATIEAPGDDLSKAKVEFWAEAASITTGNEQRDAHLRTAEFFDVEKHPRITFVAKEAKSIDHDGSWDLVGELSINGLTKPIVLQVEWGGVMKDPWGNTKAGLTINGKISRKEWHLNWNAALETGGVLVSDEVRISCEIQLAKQG
jgi:polyisoprenoid-binding protein YceI